VLGLVLCLGKAVVIFMHVTLWRRRAERMKKAVGGKTERTQIPFVPILGVFSFITYCFIFLMTSLDIANARNGWAGALYSLGWLIFGFMSIFYFLKMLRLGKRLIPLSKKVINSAGASLEIQAGDLGKFDKLGSVLFFTESVAVLAQFVLLGILGIAHPLDIRIVLAALGVMALFLSVQGGSIMWLVERTISAIKRSQYKTSSSDGNNNGSSHMRSDLQAIVFKMREQQLIILLLASSGAIVYALAIARVVPLAWYIMLIHMYYDTIANLVVVFSMARRSRRHNHQSARGPRTPLKSPGADADATNNGRPEPGPTMVGSRESDSTFSPRNILPSTEVTANPTVPRQEQAQNPDMGMIMVYESKMGDSDGQ
jgi:hypothetical protein